MPQSTYSVERSVTIAAPPEAAYEQIVNLRNWRNWSVWEILDPELRRTYVGSEAGEGAAYTWSGNRKVGSGSMKIVEVEEGSRVLIDMVFERPLPACTDAEFVMTGEEQGCRVTWTMKGAMTPKMKVRSLVRPHDEWVGADLERSLEELKLRLEERHA